MAPLASPRHARLLLFALLFLTLGALALACSSGEDDSEPAPVALKLEVSLGLAQAQTGAGAIYGKAATNGAQLAIKEINANPDANLAITTTIVDDRSSIEGATAAFTELAGKKVHAIIGPTLSNTAFASQKVAQQAGIPVIAASNTAQGITDTGDFIFRLALTDAVVLPLVVERVNAITPVKNAVLILDGKDAYSRGAADAMRRSMTVVSGGTIVQEFDVSTTDIATGIAALSGKQVDAFLMSPLFETSAAILTSLRAAGFKQPVIGADSFNTPDLARLAGAAAEGAYVGAEWNPGLKDAASARFVEAYKREFGAEPDVFAAQGYVAVYVLADALKRAGSTEGRSVRDALASTKDLETVFGKLSFSAKREAVHPVVLQQFRSGKLEIVPSR